LATWPSFHSIEAVRIEKKDKPRMPIPTEEEKK
jgi:hypothetical protein